MLIELVILVTLFTPSFQQGPAFSCKTEVTIESIFSQARQKQTCTISNINSYNDFLNIVDKGATGNYGNIATLRFTKSSLSLLPDKMFDLYTSIKNIDASNIMLNTISPTAFDTPKYWDTINLSNNNIMHLVARVFAGLNINSLDISYNVIETIDENSFVGSTIDTVDLSFNKIKSILFTNAMKYFTLMQLNDNKIEIIEETDMKLSHWESQSLFVGVPTYPTFNMANNRIKKFNCVSTVLLSVNLEKNKLLTDVVLNQCRIDELIISDCPLLTNVALNDNLLSLTAQNNNFSDIDLSKASKLNSLTLDNCSLDSSKIQEIFKMENLTTLDLSRNYIGPLNISTFSKLKKLSVLKLAGCDISNGTFSPISYGTFSHQSQVTHLDISDNRLGTFDMHTIFAMYNLLILDVAGNDLNELTNFETSHTTLLHLKAIDISNNRFPCKYLHRMMKLLTVFKIALLRSNNEENEANIHGVRCIDDNGNSIQIDSLTPDKSNTTEIKEKLNEVIGKFSQFQSDVNNKINQMENRFNIYASSQTNMAALKSDQGNMPNLQVKNSAMLEFALFVVCICFIVFATMKMFVYVRRNFLNRPQPVRGISENTLNTHFDEYP